MYIYLKIKYLPQKRLKKYFFTLKHISVASINKKKRKKIVYLFIEHRQLKFYINS